MHRIFTKTLELETANQAVLETVQSRLLSALKGPQGDRLERLFDQLSGPQDVLKIDRLEIELGDIDGPDWLDQFFARMSAATVRAISRAQGGSPTSPEAYAPISETSQTATGVQRMATPQSTADAVLFYLRFGHLPWWSDLKPKHGWLPDVMEGLPTPARLNISQTALRDPKVLHRLILHLPPALLAEVLCPALPQEPLRALTQLAHTLADCVTPEPSTPALRRFWQDILTLPPTPDTQSFLAQTGRIWARSIVGHASPDAEKIARVLKDHTMDCSLRDVLLDALNVEIKRNSTEQPPAQRSRRHKTQPPAKPPTRNDDPTFDPPSRPATQDRSPDHSRPAKIDKEPTRAQPESETNAPRPSEASDTIQKGTPPPQSPDTNPHVSKEIAVTGAGIILLHPFLSVLFENCGYLEQGRFASEADAGHAAHLLGYLAYGQAENDEAALTLPKILTGLELPQVLDPAPPTPDSMALADELLEAVVGHWSALGQSSAPWLREVFLNRSGLLSPSDTGWQLEIETRAQDVLLNSLPWGYGVIALPWMPQPLVVRWLN